MTTYKIKTTSPILWILTLIIPTLIFALAAIYLLPSANNLTTIALFLVMALTFPLQRFTSLGIVSVTLTNQAISVEWLKQYIFHHRQNQHIPFSEIESYKHQPDQNFDLFQLTLKDGAEIRFSHFTLTSGDNFDIFVTAFSQAVGNHNENKSGPNNSKAKLATEIKREKTSFELASPFIVLPAIILIIALPLILYFSSTEKQHNSFLPFVAIPGAIYYLIQYYRYRKNKNVKS